MQARRNRRGVQENMSEKEDELLRCSRWHRRRQQQPTYRKKSNIWTVAKTGEKRGGRAAGHGRKKRKRNGEKYSSTHITVHSFVGIYEILRILHVIVGFWTCLYVCLSPWLALRSYTLPPLSFWHPLSSFLYSLFFPSS